MPYLLFCTTGFQVVSLLGSAAAMEVMALRNCLAAGKKDLAQRFFKQAAAVIDIPWDLTVANDRRLSGARAPAPRRLINWYMAKLQVTARRDPELALAFQSVGNLFTQPPIALAPAAGVARAQRQPEARR
jgi:hypothetical protein